MLQAPGGGRAGGRRGGGWPTQERDFWKKEGVKNQARQDYAEAMREVVRRFLAEETSLEEFEEAILLLTRDLNNVLND
jgi:hypothetical protein